VLLEVAAVNACRVLAVQVRDRRVEAVQRLARQDSLLSTSRQAFQQRGSLRVLPPQVMRGAAMLIR
jgi:aerobic-type carbon monoxide dehydrogenase small subunit (CoxS/CutS family)